MEHFKFWRIYLLKACKHLLLIASSPEKATWVVRQEWKHWERRPQGRRKCCIFPLNFWLVSIRRLWCVWRCFPRTRLYLHRVNTVTESTTPPQELVPGHGGPADGSSLKRIRQRWWTRWLPCPPQLITPLLPLPAELLEQNHTPGYT